MKKTAIIIITALLFVFGCGKHLQVKDDPCSVPESAGSVICEQFNNLGISVYDADLFFKIANVEFVKHNVYTKDTAIKFLDSVEGLLGNSTYSEVAMYIISKVEELKDNYGMEIALVFDYVSRFEEMKIPVNSYDIYLMKEHIKNQKQLLGVF